MIDQFVVGFAFCWTGELSWWVIGWGGALPPAAKRIKPNSIQLNKEKIYLLKKQKVKSFNLFMSSEKSH